AVKAMERNKGLAKSINEIINTKCIDDTLYGQIECQLKAYGELNISFKENVIDENTNKFQQINLFYDTNYNIEYQIIFSNINDTPQNIFKFYNERGNSENIFKELKQDFGMNKLAHHEFF
ncbi:MAG: hypothetical protein ACK5HR_05505, partial [Mycoplasmatales bacterium]